MPVTYGDSLTEPRRGDLIVGHLPGEMRAIAGVVVEVGADGAERGLKVAFVQEFTTKMDRSRSCLGRWAFRGYEPSDIEIEANTTYLAAADCALLWRKPEPSKRGPA